MIAGLVSNSAEVPCRVSKGSLMEAENVIVKIAGEEKERKENGILQPGRPWIGAPASSFSQCSDFEPTTSLSLAENLRSDQRGSE